MLAEAVLDRAIEDVADGRAVDWNLLDSHAGDAEARNQLRMLKILSEIADLHRSTIDELDEPVPDTIGDRGLATTAAAAPTWGRYELREKVGEGTFGSVYRAWDPELEREIAIKILHGQVADDRLRERLLHEGRALARVRHPNVVNVLGVEAHEHRIGLCMEFVQGQTLDDYVRMHGKLDAREAVQVAQDVCRALAAVHGAAFVHRDVKARNIMRESAGRIVLMDFGTGRETRLLEPAGPARIAGTPLYMAPEVLGGDPASPRSDVYSVGVLLFYLVTGAYPVEGRTLEELDDAHRCGRRRHLDEFRTDFPSSFVRTVETAIDPDIDARYPHAGAMLEALGRIYGGGLTTTIVLKRLLMGVTSLALAAAISIAFGFLSSTAFNVGLNRWEFASETLWDWMVWGIRASMLPLFLLTFAWFVLGVFLVCRRLLVRLSSKAAALDARSRRVVAQWAQRRNLDDVTLLSSGILMLSAAGLVLAWWSFWPLITALATRISTWPLDRLWLLSEAFSGTYHVDYRVTFSALVLVTVAAWYGVLKLAQRRGQAVNRTTLAGGAAIVGLMLASLNYPYRLLRHSGFEAASWRGETCYIIGERADERLIFCPRIDPPRNRVVPREADGLVPLGRRESIYTTFAPPGGS